MFLIASTLVGAAALVFCEVVSFLAPSKFPATFVIAFPPLLSPSFVKDTALSVSEIFVPGFAGSSFPGVIVTPFPSTFVVFPSLSLVIVPVGPTVVVLVPSVVVVPVGVVTTEFPDVSFTSTFDKSFNSFANE